MTIAAILSFLTICYAWGLLRLRSGLDKVKSERNTSCVPVSVIVAARNEEAQISACLQSLVSQDYPKQLLQIIIVDDRSHDRTAAIVRDFMADHPTIELIPVHDTVSGFAPKKYAIDQAIRRATGDIIFTTDADCTPGKHWVSEMLAYFEPEVGMVAGYNPYDANHKRNALPQKMLALDYFSMAAVAAASAGLGFPVSCSGGNLAYRKSLYVELGGFRNIQSAVSGDDDLFLEQVRDRTDWQIRYATHPRTFVPTQPPHNMRAFVDQRVRYASKGRRYAGPVQAVLVGVYLLNVSLLAVLLVAAIDHRLLLIGSVCWGVKATAEFLFLARASAKFCVAFNSRYFLPTAILHPLYIATFGLLGQIRPIHWKGDRYPARAASTYP